MNDAPNGVHVLQTPKTEAQASVVKVAQELLEGVEAGEIVEICAAVVYADGHVSSLANQTEQRSKRIGSVAQLLHDLCGTERP